MLKGKHNCLVDSAREQNARRSTGEALVDEEFDTAEVVGWAPVTLIEQLLLEDGELEALVTLSIYDQREANAATGGCRSTNISIMPAAKWETYATRDPSMKSLVSRTELLILRI